MADKPAKKRVVKNPESFRERAQKATTKQEEPKKGIKKSPSFVSGYIRAVKKELKIFFGLEVFKVFKRPVRLIGKVIFPTYLRKSWQELRLVTWPSWKQSRQLTFAVIAFAVVFGAAIAAVDYGLDKVFKSILLK